MDGVTGDVVATALRRRKRWRIAGCIVLALAIGSAVVSHVVAPAVGSGLSGRQYPVVRVETGDTLVVRLDGGGEESVRLLGVAAPDTYYAAESQQYLTRRIAAAGPGNRVTLKTDEPQTRDAAGRLLGYVYLNDSENLNLSAVRDGAAFADRVQLCSIRSQLELTEGLARTKKIGLWNGMTKSQMPAWRQAWMDARHIRN